MIQFARDKMTMLRIVINQKLHANKKGFYRQGKLVEFSSESDGNKLIREKILSNQPLMITRHGSTELGFVTMGLGIEYLMTYSGFFPQDKSLGKRFKEEYLEHCKQIDILCAWNFRHGYFKQEERLFNLAADAQLATITSLSPFLFDDPWSAALEGKKVLVVHPFKETIINQYALREKLFQNPKVLPKFTSFHIVQAIQSLANQEVPFESWFYALAHMQNEIQKVDFDIALIGCGAYGLPLASYVKSLGKQAIHVGGALQLLFGIKGKRWESSGYNYNERFYNENWVYASETEKPKQAHKVENACYW